MKKVLVCASLIALSASAFAADTSGVYVKGELGASKMIIRSQGETFDRADKFKPVYGAAVGYKFNENFRADVNAQLRKTKDINDVKLQSKAVFVNAYYDLKSDTVFTPYATAGIGFAKNSLSNLGSGFTKTDSTNFAYNAGLGSKINVNKNVDLDLSYRFVNLGNFKYTASNVENKFKAKAHELMAGVIYNF